MDQPLPTRAQVELVFEFIASFIGSAYSEGQFLHYGESGRLTVIPEDQIAAPREAWLREHRDEIIDSMVESECAVENPQRIIPRPCGKTNAHGGPHRLFNDPNLEVDYECPGIKAHPKTQIGKGEGRVSIVCPDPADCPEGIPDDQHVGGAGGTPVHLPPDGKVVPGHFDHGVPSDARPKVSTHRNAQMLRDMGHDL